MEKKRREKAEQKKGFTAGIAILVMLCLAAGGIYLDTFYGSGKLAGLLTQVSKTEQKAKKVSAEESMAVDISSKAMIATFDAEFLLCTKDGVKYFASMGDQKWNDTFNMTAPILQQDGEYTAVGDLSGKTICVYNRAGKLYSLQTEGSLIQFALNENGYLSVITKGTNVYRIRVYNEKGTLLKERVEESSGIYPLCADISDDNRIFAVSYLDTTDIAPIGRVVSFYISAAESEEHTDSMFAAVEKPNEMIPIISYRSGGTLAAISDTAVYGIGTDGQEKWAYPLENTIDRIALGEKDAIVFALGDSIAGKEGRKKGTVCRLNTSGKETASYETGENVTYLFASARGIICGNDRDYIGLRSNGSLSWQYRATGDLSELMPMEKLNRVMLLGKDSVFILHMSKESEAENSEKKKDAEQPDDTENPTDDAEKLTEDAEKTDGAEKPTENAANPADAENPAEDTKQPADAEAPTEDTPTSAEPAEDGEETLP